MRLFVTCPTCGESDQTNIDPACDTCGGQRYVPLAEGASLVEFSMPIEDPEHPGGKFMLHVKKGKHGLWYGTSPDIKGLGLIAVPQLAQLKDSALVAAASARVARRLTIIDEAAHGHEGGPQEAA